MRECADDYDRLVVKLSNDWRIIECRDGIQWILQRQGSPKGSRKDDWRARSYCRTSEALRRCTRYHAGKVDVSALEALASLPAQISKFPRISYKKCSVVPFPLASRRNMIRRVAQYAVQLRPEAAEKHIQLQLQVQADTMRRRGIDNDLARNELAHMEFAIRTLLSRSVSDGAK